MRVMILLLAAGFFAERALEDRGLKMISMALPTQAVDPVA